MVVCLDLVGPSSLAGQGAGSRPYCARAGGLQTAAPGGKKTSEVLSIDSP